MFEKGLPGYDAWLDNHGNPGIYDDDDWVLTETIEVTETEPDVFRIVRADNKDQVLVIDFRGDRMLFNGEDIETDDFMSYVGLIDGFREMSDGILNRTITIEGEM